MKRSGRRMLKVPKYFPSIRIFMWINGINKAIPDRSKNCNYHTTFNKAITKTDGWEKK